MTDRILPDATCNNLNMSTREDVHRLVDVVPEARLPVIEQILRASLEGPITTAPRRFASAGALSAERDLAQRSEDILRAGEEHDPDGSDADGGRNPA